MRRKSTALPVIFCTRRFIHFENTEIMQIERIEIWGKLYEIPLQSSIAVL